MSVLLNLPAKAPSLSALFMAAAASVLLLLLARFVFSLTRLLSCPNDTREKNPSFLSLALVLKPWSRSLPVSLPFSLTLPEKPSIEVGNGIAVGRSHKRAQSLPVVNWQPRSGPQFQPPPPALYESPVPLSMAKMIMSRHTFRRPNPNRSRRSSTASASQPTSPPQTPSRLYHSIA